MCPTPSPVNFCRSKFGGWSSNVRSSSAPEALPIVSVTRSEFEELSMRAGTVEKFWLQSDLLRVDIISWGCTITALEVKDRQSRASDVVLGFAKLDGILQKQPYFGAVVGKVASRIAKGTFTLDGKECKLAINNRPNSLHGGIRRFDKVLWTPQVLSNGIHFSQVSVTVRKVTLGS